MTNPLRLKYEKPSVLIIDDEIKICELLHSFLAQSELFKNIVIAESASIGAMKLQNEEFDLIIVDYKLPGRSGIQLVESLKKIPRHSKLKFILISGYLDNRTMIKVLGAGIKHVIVKPFTRLEFLEKVKAILKI